MIFVCSPKYTNIVGEIVLGLRNTPHCVYGAGNYRLYNTEFPTFTPTRQDDAVGESISYITSGGSKITSFLYGVPTFAGCTESKFSPELLRDVREDTSSALELLIRLIRVGAVSPEAVVYAVLEVDPSVKRTLDVPRFLQLVTANDFINTSSMLSKNYTLASTLSFSYFDCPSSLEEADKSVKIDKFVSRLRTRHLRNAERADRRSTVAIPISTQVPK